jgi:uncharacterized membrane-anchored protein
MDIKKYSKVPEATALFWLTKILTTGMGETMSDFLVRIMNPLVAIGLAALVLAIALKVQFSVKKYIPFVYWFAVIMVSVFGTMAADVLHVGIGIPYIVSAIFFFVALLFIFLVWYVNEHTLSVHSITTRRREIFYWLAVLTTFALGTAVGDMTATTLHLGYLSSGIVFGVLILVPALAYWWFELNEVLVFWVAYILTRPLGASFADWMGVSTARSGLGWGTGSVSFVLFVIIFLLVGYQQYAKKKE